MNMFENIPYTGWLRTTLTIRSHSSHQNKTQVPPTNFRNLLSFGTTAAESV